MQFPHIGGDTTVNTNTNANPKLEPKSYENYVHRTDKKMVVPKTADVTTKHEEIGYAGEPIDTHTPSSGQMSEGPHQDNITTTHDTTHDTTHNSQSGSASSSGGGDDSSDDSESESGSTGKKTHKKGFGAMMKDQIRKFKHNAEKVVKSGSSNNNSNSSNGVVKESDGFDKNKEFFEQRMEDNNVINTKEAVELKDARHKKRMAGHNHVTPPELHVEGVNAVKGITKEGITHGANGGVVKTKSTIIKHDAVIDELQDKFEAEGAEAASGPGFTTQVQEQGKQFLQNWGLMAKSTDNNATEDTAPATGTTNKNKKLKTTKSDIMENRKEKKTTAERKNDVINELQEKIDNDEIETSKAYGEESISDYCKNWSVAMAVSSAAVILTGVTTYFVGKKFF